MGGGGGGRPARIRVGAGLGLEQPPEVTVSPRIEMSVEIISPEHNETVTGIVNVCAKIKGGIGEKGVTFKINGRSFRGKQVKKNEWRKEYDTNQLSNGSYLLTAEARDSANNIAKHSIRITH